MRKLSDEKIKALADLPDGMKRWTVHRRARVARALIIGAVTMAEVTKRYGFSPDECAELMRRYRKKNMKVTLREDDIGCEA